MNSIGCSFEKTRSQRKLSCKEKKRNVINKKNSYKEISFKEKELINKVKCFAENDNREVQSDRKRLF